MGGIAQVDNQAHIPWRKPTQRRIRLVNGFDKIRIGRACAENARQTAGDREHRDPEAGPFHPS